MPGGYRGKAIKIAHTETEALAHLLDGSKTKGYRLKKTGVPVYDVTIKEHE